MILAAYSKDKINLLNDSLFNFKFLKEDSKNPFNSIVNLYAALTNKQIFYRKKTKLAGAPFLVGVSNLLRSYMNKTKLEEFHKLYIQYLNVNNFPKSNVAALIKKWIKNDRIPFPIIRLISILHKDDEILISFIKDLKHITDRNGQSKFKPPYLLRDILNSKGLYDVGVSMGDGGLFNHEQMISDGAPGGKELHLVEKYLQSLKLLKIKVWGLSQRSINISRGKGENKNMFKLTVSNRWFIHYLHFVYGLPIGDKIRQGLRIPEIIALAPENEKNYLLSCLFRGLFDSDGHYHSGSSMAQLYTASFLLKKQVSDFLGKNGIKHSLGKEEIRVLSENYKEFAELVGSSHPRKIKNIIKRLSLEPKTYIFKGLNEIRLDKDRNFDFINNKLKCRLKSGSLPTKPSKRQIELAKYLIPQKDDNKSLVKRESTNMNKDLMKEIQEYFNCKITRNPTSGAYFIHSSSLTKFLRTFFIYEKAWQPLNHEELEKFHDRMIGFLEVNNE